MAAPRERYLFISDLQIPFEARHALKFCKHVQKEFKIPDENVFNVGDEVDQYFGSAFLKDPDALHSPLSELRETREKVMQWGRAFPKMKLATSNHGMRWAKRAFAAQIPSQMIVPYQEIIGAPDGWKWQDAWNIASSKAPIRMIHGMGYGGMYAYRTACVDTGRNIVFGHLHASAGIAHIQTAGHRSWGFCVGSLIDREAYAFHYGKDSRFKPILGVGVVLDGGLTPIFVPYETY